MEEKNVVTFDDIYKATYDFLKKYPLTISWRIRQHAKILAKHMNEGEELFYAFAAQNNADHFKIYESCIVLLTNKRILVGRKNLLWGYRLLNVTPDLFNDFEVYKGLIFGRVDIDTMKEVIQLSDIDPRALVDIESNLSEYLNKIKPQYMKECSKN